MDGSNLEGVGLTQNEAHNMEIFDDCQVFFTQDRNLCGGLYCYVTLIPKHVLFEIAIVIFSLVKLGVYDIT